MLANPDPDARSGRGDTVVQTGGFDARSRASYGKTVKPSTSSLQSALDHGIDQSDVKLDPAKFAQSGQGAPAPRARAQGKRPLSIEREVF